MADDDFDAWLHDEPDDIESDSLVVAKQRLADLLGLAPKTIDRYRRDGMPCVGEGRALRFRVPDCVRWLLASNGDGLEDAKRRAADATARKREIEAARLEGRFVDIADVESIIRDQIARLQSELLAIPARLPAAVRKTAEAELQAAINRLSFEDVADA